MMNKFLWIAFLVFILFGCDHSIGQSQNQPDENQNETENHLLSPNDFEKAYKEKKDAKLLDIRTSMEVKNGYIEGMEQVDWFRGDFKSIVENKFDKDSPLFVYCGIGGRSQGCVDMLKQTGYKEVYELRGGMKAWEKANKPVKKS